MIGFSLGSFGDIVALIQIAYQVKHALQDAHGSVREYQDLQDDISKFVNILGQVIATYKKYEPSPFMYSLAHAVKNVVEESTSLLEDARDTWGPEYEECLGPRRSGKPIKSAYKKIRFRSEKTDIAYLREKLAKNISYLGLLTGLVISQSAQSDDASLMQRVEEVKQAIEARDAQSLEVFRSLDCKFDEMKTTIARQSRTIVGILLFLHAIYKAVCNAIAVLERHAETVVALHEELTNPRPVYALDPTRGQDMILDDAFGKRHYFNCNEFHDWHALDFMIAHQFEGSKGFFKVQRMEYTLEESFSGKELDRRAPIRFAIRPGMKIDMCMIFVGIRIDGVCPRCKTRAQVTEGVTVVCQKLDCDMQFRCTERFIMLFESNTTSSARSPFDNETHQIEEFANQATGLPPADDIEPSDFKRVHLIDEKNEHVQPTEFPSPVELQQKDSTQLNTKFSDPQRDETSQSTGNPVTPPVPPATHHRHNIGVESNKRDDNGATDTGRIPGEPVTVRARSGRFPSGQVVVVNRNEASSSVGGNVGSINQRTDTGGDLRGHAMSIYTRGVRSQSPGGVIVVNRHQTGFDRAAPSPSYGSLASRESRRSR